jgi:AcrR family transcriptional regulator
MSTTTAFRRARSDEQRAERREAILATAADMLATTRVNELTLNELARQVGLAKSNVLRYFESREAILLELFDREYSAWLDDLEARLDLLGSPGVEAIAQAIADSAASRPILCDLAASSAAVLEHNVSAEVAANYKLSAIDCAKRLAGIVGPLAGGFTMRESITFVGGVNVVIGGVWSMSQPSPGMAAAYEKYPELRALRLDLAESIRELVATLLVGLQHRHD